jgi:2,5-diamino-6-(ribosylamino)-4(3H)-pyrimidinone 5'-phosphate reductase
MAETIPHVVAHVAVSLDGATTGFEPDIARFYALAGTWREDVTLTGADTVLAQEAALAAAPRPGPVAAGPLLAVVDGRGRVTQWDALREVGHWRDVLALSCARTPARPGNPPEVVTGTDRVDLVAALAELARRGARTVRVDSGGALIGALLAAGLVAEVSLLVHPLLAGAAGAYAGGGAGTDAGAAGRGGAGTDAGQPGERRWFGETPPPAARLSLIAAEPVGDNGLVWLRYRVA